MSGLLWSFTWRLMNVRRSVEDPLFDAQVNVLGR